MIIEHRADPWDQLFRSMLAVGQRKHEERMLRLMLNAEKPAPRRPSPDVVHTPATPYSRAVPAPPWIPKKKSAASFDSKRWIKCLDEAESSDILSSDMDSCMGR